jgi:Haem-binding domain
MKKQLTIILAGIFVIMQFFRPESNLSNDQTYHISKQYKLPSEVERLLKLDCYDCHSNYTNYTWPYKLQPTAWWMSGHVREGKKHLNFSAFTALSPEEQRKKFDAITEMVTAKEMPLPSYSYVGFHRQTANITDAERQTLVNWANTEMDTLDARLQK